MSITFSYFMANGKYKVSICVDEETLILIREKIRQGHFRNRSHAFEYSVNKTLKWADAK